MELDNEEIAEYESNNAFHGDSATAGASAVRAAEDRALLAELESIEGKMTITFLWDLKKIFDSINIPMLVEEAERTGFPLRQLALSLAVHLAPRRLRLGKAIGMPILEIGQSILAGCKRSTHLARVYTVTGIKELDDAHPDVSTGQHVDDVSNLAVGRNEDELVGRAVRYAAHFASIMKRLRMTISCKSMVVPATKAAARIAKHLQNLGIP
jgi:hypothetical protein